MQNDEKIGLTPQVTIKIMSVVGARPNFMKIAPFVHAIDRWNGGLRRKPIEAAEGGDGSEEEAIPTLSHSHTPIPPQPSTQNPTPNTQHLHQKMEHFLVHTGQHYDPAMYHSFFEALNIPTPDIDLGIGSGSHAEQVGNTMIAFEKVLLKEQPDWVVVVGDVNATCACSITAKKHHIPVAHIEAGLRSRDERMPEEINRLVTDSISDLLLTPDELSSTNLRQEGHPEHKIKFIGNIMIDTLEAHRTAAEKLNLQDIINEYAISAAAAKRSEAGHPASLTPNPHTPTLTYSHTSPRISHLESNGFAVLTLHRPSNVDHPDTLEPLVECLREVVAAEMPLVWTLHPRTRKNLELFGLWDEIVADPNIILINPVGYHAMLRLNMVARVMLTDSGGLQEECCVLGTPCITMRANTERPVTLVEHGGVSVLTGPDPVKIADAFKEFIDSARKSHRPPLWDGQTAARIVDAFLERQR